VDVSKPDHIGQKCLSQNRKTEHDFCCEGFGMVFRVVGCHAFLLQRGSVRPAGNQSDGSQLLSLSARSVETLQESCETSRGHPHNQSGNRLSGAVLAKAGPGIKSLSSSTTKPRRWRQSPPATMGKVCPQTAAKIRRQGLFCTHEPLKTPLGLW
jgi:hypothetical protein